MATLPLLWKEGEGYDLHLLRGVDDTHRAPPSKALVDSLLIDPSFPVNQFPIVFDPHFKGAPNSQPLGVNVDTATGVVTATTPSGPDKLRNFLMTASQNVTGGDTTETIIRVHLHGSIQKIWLTPSTLTVHARADERRFTVLALFDDGVVGDITEWPELTYHSANTSVVTVANTGDPDPLSPQPVPVGGKLTVVALGGDSVITASLALTTPPTNKSATATVRTRSAWAEGGKNTKVRFVAGRTSPIAGVVDPDDPTNVNTVIGAAANVLFLAEGFRQERRLEFDKIVRTVVAELRTKGYVSPFPLLKDSINYWSAFVPSNEDAISVLGDQEIHIAAQPIPLPRKPLPTASQWTVEHMIHEGGLPVPVDAALPDPAAWVASRAKLYNLPGNVPAITNRELGAWNALSSRSLLNEADTAFGLAHYDRPRASAQDQSEWRLLLDRRRTSEASLMEFVGRLTFGKDPTTNDPIEIGTTWQSNLAGPSQPKDAGLVCLLCSDTTRGGAWMPAGMRLPYFAANAGQADRASVTAVANGQNLHDQVAKTFSAPILASRVARGCGRALGLGDEFGDDRGIGRVPGAVDSGPNLQPADNTIVTFPAGTARSIDATKIKWLWPRVINAGIIETQFDANGTLESPQKCDPNGSPNPNGTHLLVRLRSPSPEPFHVNDAVRIRVTVDIRGGLTWSLPAVDEFVTFALFVQKTISDTEIVVGYRSPSPPQLGYLSTTHTQLDLANFSPLAQYSLIAPRVRSGTEVRVVADDIWKHIDATDSPLNAPRNSPGAVCIPGSPAFQAASPTNLPQGPRSYPYPLAGVLGIYDGGGQTDCGVFRPAGRCRMRAGFDTTVPFCHVCSYVIVDMLDPTKHQKLDRSYPEVGP
jgi:hypothetical protein